MRMAMRDAARGGRIGSDEGGGLISALSGGGRRPVGFSGRLVVVCKHWSGMKTGWERAEFMERIRPGVSTALERVPCMRRYALRVQGRTRLIAKGPRVRVYIEKAQQG